MASSENHINIATIVHIDHNKTTLSQAIANYIIKNGIESLEDCEKTNAQSVDNINMLDIIDDKSIGIQKTKNKKVKTKYKK